MFCVSPMTREHAEKIAGWTYPGAYAMYSFSRDEETLNELMSGEYFACADEKGALIGFYCYGQAARIPAATEYATGDCTDFGLGMTPALCGQGRGADFVNAGIAYARDALGAQSLRLVVAAFNARAIRVYRRCGFAEAGAVIHQKSREQFIVMIRP